MQADSIKIECDEDGFHLVMKTSRTRFDFNIQDCAEALHEQVNLIIGGWLAEGRAARAEYDRAEYAHERQTGQHAFECGPEDIDESGGMAENSYDRSEAYDQADPKHKDWHSIHADIYDNREKV